MNGLYEKIVEFKAQGMDMVLVTAVEKQGEGPVEVGKKMLFTEKGESFGTVGGGAIELYAQNQCKTLLKTRSHLHERYVLSEGKVAKEAKTLPMKCGGVVTLFYEFIGFRNHVHIFGGGHVGQALANVLKPLNFHLSVIDERKPIIDAFIGADATYLMPFVDYVAEGRVKEHSFVIVCTPSHKYDYHVMNKLLEMNIRPKYMGMLCSLEKLKDYLDKTYETFGRDIDLSYFHSPIGLDLGGGSPEDIAIAIAAEMLVVHHDKKNHRHMRENAHDKNHYW